LIERNSISAVSSSVGGLKVMTMKLGTSTTKFRDARRKHHHFEATIVYHDGEKVVRTYTDKRKATNFAERQKKSPVIKTARVRQVS